jgi:primosomal protein N' (replication factor Y) (superfamily II helicase)
VPRSAPDVEHDLGRGPIARVVVEGAPFHLDAPLDYLIPAGLDVRVGHRVVIDLAGRRTSGLVVELADGSALASGRLRPLIRLLGDVPWALPDDIELLRWAAARFGAPLGDVVRHAFPARVVDVERQATAAGWWPPAPRTAAAAADTDTDTDADADAAAAGGEHVAPHAEAHGWDVYGEHGRALVGAAEALEADAPLTRASYHWRPLPGEDVAARLSELALRTLACGRDVLLIVPDPASRVADALLRTVRAAVGEAAIDLRGGPSKRLIHRAWLQGRAGVARVVVGERGSAFVPLAALGLAVVLDEANPVHKELRSPRHHAREVVLERARRSGGIGLAVATVPSAVARALLDAGRLTSVVAPREVELARRPVVRLETGELEARARISRRGMQVLRDAVQAGGYAVVLAARRGEGRALACSRCGSLVRCSTCAAAVARRSDGGWWCPTCAASSARPPRCERCGPGPLAPLAAGAERLGAELARSLPSVAVLEGHAAELPPAPAVLVMTRGSVLDQPPPGAPVLGVVLPDLDGALRRPVIDAAEDALRLAFALASWTVGASEGPGSPGDVRPVRVVVETRDPSHHALRALVDWDPDGFWAEEAALRAPLRLPPTAMAIRVTTGAGDRDVVGRLRAHVAPGDDVIGPLPREGGGMGFLVRCTSRADTLTALRPLREQASRSGTELRIDVDPIDLG